MFSLPDHQAHKLYRMMGLPLALAVNLLRFVAIGSGIMVAQRTEYGTVVKIAIACVAFEIISGLLAAAVLPISWMCKRFFFSLVEEIPTHGANKDEARDIVLRGRMAELEIKLNKNLLNWSPDDSEEMVSLLNWRARLFYGGKLRRRFNRRVAAYKLLCKKFTSETGKSLEEELDQVEIENVKHKIEEINSKIPNSRPSLMEKIIVDSRTYNSFFAFVIIVIFMGYVALSR